MNNLTFSHKANSSPHGFLNKFCQTLYQTFMNSLDYRENRKRLSSFNVDSITLILKLLLLLFSHWIVSDCLQPQELQHARLLCPSLSPWVSSNSCPLSWWCHPNISSSAFPFSFALNFSQHQGLFQWVGSSHQVAKVLELQLQHLYFQWIFRVDFL